MKNTGWIISQEWHDVLFMHHEVSAETLAPHCPFPLDLYQGKAIISIVPFRMRKIRFPYLPHVPGISDLWELNLRTYVNVGGIKGVYFFTLDTDSVLGEFIARKFFHLPYNFAHIEAKVTQEKYYFNHRRNQLRLELEAKMSQDLSNSDFDHWATERYSLFTLDKKFHYQGRVQHDPWKLQKAEIVSINDSFSDLLPNLNLSPLKSASYSRKINVRFSPFKKIGRVHESV